MIYLSYINQQKGCENVIDKIKADLIIRTHYESILKYCLVNLKHNTQDAEDITQEVFLFFETKCHELKDNNIKAWLFKVAFLKIKEYNRSIQKDIDNTTLEDFDTEDEGADICAMLEELNSFDSDNIEKYRDIVFSKLSEKEQALYQKHYIEGKSHSQIAEDLNTNTKNVSVMLSRLNKKLKVMETLVVYAVGQVILSLFF